MLVQIMNPTFGESIWIEILRWGLVAIGWLSLCFVVLSVPALPGFYRRHHLRHYFSHLRRHCHKAEDRTGDTYRAERRVERAPLSSVDSVDA